MGARQRKLSLRGMVELGPAPIHRRMAQGAIRGKRRGHMAWIVGALHVLQVARHAIGWQRGELIVHMTRGARHRRVFACQRELSRVVVERRAVPIRGRVTHGTIRRKPRCHVIRRRGALHVLQMAGHAIRAQRRELIVHMTRGARHRRVFARQRKLSRVVIERRSVPVRRRVAQRAIRRESGRHVIRGRRSLLVLQVTRHAVRAQRRELIIDVASSAGHGGVLARERELRRAVVERRARPVRSGVAQRAIRRKPSRHVIRGRCSLHVFQVTRYAVRAQRRELIVDVASGAGHRSVLAGERETSAAVIERRTGPVGRRVAQRAILWETRRHVIRGRCSLHVFQVARNAGCAEIRELIVHVTRCAGHANMSAGKRKLSQIVVEVSNCPAGCVVTLRTVLRKSGRHMVRVGAAREIFGVATEAVRRCSLKAAARMTTGARQLLVNTGQGEVREPGMVEIRNLPLDLVMARFASGWKSRSCVI
jgi:hypothetical protein